MLQDRINYLYFEFATPIVKEFEGVNVMFQCTNGDPQQLSQSLFFHYHSLYNRLYDATGNRKTLTNVDFGVKFLRECEKYIQDHGMTKFHNVAEVKTTSEMMMLVAVKQIKKS